MNKRTKIIILSLIILILGISFTYAYFSLNIAGNPTYQSFRSSGAILAVTFTDGEKIETNNIAPGYQNIKTFTIVNNGTVQASYSLIFDSIINTFHTPSEFVYKLSCESDKAINNCQSITSDTTFPVTAENAVLLNDLLIAVGETQTFTLYIKFINTGENQSYNEGASFSASIKVQEQVNTLTLADVVSIGDYINYPAGTYSSTLPEPDSSTFSVFAGTRDGRNRNVGVDCTNSYANLGPVYSNWRVINIDEGIITLVHAGTPLCYKGSWVGETNRANLVNYNYSEFLNPEYASSAGVLTKELIETIDGAEVVYDGGFYDEHMGVLLAGTRYWVPYINPDNAEHLLNVTISGWIGSSGGNLFGVRPVVTLKHNIYISSGSGTSSDPYVISPNPAATDTVNQHGLLTGYYENWNSNYNLRFKNVPINYNIIALAFAEQSDTKGGAQFSLDQYLSAHLGGYTEEEFKQDIKIVQSRGQKVIVSIGGADANIIVDDQASVDAFVSSVKNIIDTYDLDGIDINLENSDDINPQLLASAINEVCDYYGDHFILTMAPQTVDVISDRYGNLSGKYYDLIQLTMDNITIVNMQLYNTGDQYGLNGVVYDPGTVDFMTAYAEILMEAGLDERKVGLGTVYNSASKGYAEPEIVNDAITSLRSGGTTIGGTYVLQRAYPHIGGIMLYSLNKDGYQSFRFSNKYREVLE